MILFSGTPDFIKNQHQIKSFDTVRNSVYTMGKMVARNIMSPKYGTLDLERRAAALGVSKSHLSRVLAGKRESSSLMIRLQELIAAESREQSSPGNSTAAGGLALDQHTTNAQTATPNKQPK
jgi:transcriptional regulator with XRE-family HTH domain